MYLGFLNEISIKIWHNYCLTFYLQSRVSADQIKFRNTHYEFLGEKCKAFLLLNLSAFQAFAFAGARSFQR